MYDHDHDYRSNNMRDNFVTSPILMGDNVWIGSGTIILRGERIGENSVVAAGCVITKNILDNSVVYQKRENTIIERYLSK